MNFSDVIEGEKVLIKVALSDGTYSINSYSSKVEYSQSSDQIYLCSPTTGDMKHWIGKKLKIYLTRDNACFTCISQVIDQKLENNVYLLLIKELTDFEKVQRRSFYRLKIDLKVVLVSIGTVTAIDISGSGISLKSKKSIDVNSLISGVIKLRKDFIRFQGNVIACEHISAPDNNSYYIVRVKFVDLMPQNQDKIVKFVLDEQIMQRVKRLNLDT